MGRTTISLDGFAGGALLERFRLAMVQIGRNIMDPNTDPEKARSITIKITLKPDKSRRSIKTSIATNISLAPPVADETTLLIGKDIRTGRIEMSEYGDMSQSVSMEGENLPVRTEVMPLDRNFDPETGEIYQDAAPVPPKVQNGSIDLRAGN